MIPTIWVIYIVKEKLHLTKMTPTFWMLWLSPLKDRSRSSIHDMPHLVLLSTRCFQNRRICMFSMSLRKQPRSSQSRNTTYIQGRPAEAVSTGLVYRMTSSVSTFLLRARKPNKLLVMIYAADVTKNPCKSRKQYQAYTNTHRRNQIGTNSPKRTRNQSKQLIMVWSAVVMKQYCI